MTRTFKYVRPLLERLRAQELSQILGGGRGRDPLHGQSQTPGVFPGDSWEASRNHGLRNI